VCVICIYAGQVEQQRRQQQLQPKQRCCAPDTETRTRPIDEIRPRTRIPARWRWRWRWRWRSDAMLCDAMRCSRQTAYVPQKAGFPRTPEPQTTTPSHLPSPGAEVTALNPTRSPKLSRSSVLKIFFIANTVNFRISVKHFDYKCKNYI